jgi:hypothetical protein
MGAADSFVGGIRVEGAEVHLGSDAKTGSDTGATYHWVAIGQDGTGDHEVLSWAGNNTAARVVDFQDATKDVLIALVKRDNTEPLVLKRTGQASYISTGGLANASDPLTFSTGQLTLTTLAAVNEWNGVGRGEGVDGLLFFTDATAEHVSWVGNATNGRIVTTTGSNPKFALVYRTNPTSGTRALRLFTDTMTNNECSATNGLGMSDASNNEAGALVSTGIQLTANYPNTGTDTYTGLFFFDSGTAQPEEDAFDYAGRKAIHLTGSSSYIDCGTSDATLKVDGALSIEWMGATWPVPSANNFVPLLMRGLGTMSTSGNASWGVISALHDENSLLWSGGQIGVVITSLHTWPQPIATNSWRTGVLQKHGEFQHIIVTHNGTGRWRLYVNGKLSKQRDLSVTPNIQSGTGHRTLIGAQPGATDTKLYSQPMLVVGEQRFYSRELTVSEVGVRYRKNYVGSAESDISSSGLCESWDVSAASGSSLPATVDSANNGTITNGTVVTL